VQLGISGPTTEHLKWRENDQKAVNRIHNWMIKSARNHKRSLAFIMIKVPAPPTAPLRVSLSASGLTNIRHRDEVNDFEFIVNNGKRVRIEH
jgi:hypothetical protein